MNNDNVWLQQKTLRRAAKKIARNFFPKPVRQDIYSTCLEAGPKILEKYDRKEHGPLWPWVFLNMLSLVDRRMCAILILGVCESQTPWQQTLALKCLARHSKGFCTESQPKNCNKQPDLQICC
jgi:hypothetical protein